MVSKQQEEHLSFQRDNTITQNVSGRFKTTYSISGHLCSGMFFSFGNCDILYSIDLVIRSLYSVLDVVITGLVAFEIFERLKNVYGFKEK